MRKIFSQFICLVAIFAELAAVAAEPGIVPKWGRSETVFRSSVAYTNPIQQAELTVVFTSPLGESNRVNGFWDGGKTWRVRFCPGQPGRWTFKTLCSDSANKGLHNLEGEFVCTASSGASRFDKHGRVQIAGDHRRLQHADGTPFFWLADTTWIGAAAARPEDWEYYTRVRAAQQFDVSQWAISPAHDSANESAFTGTESITINPDYFKRLDGKLETLGRAGILSAIAPLMEPGSPTDSGPMLPEDQAIRLLRYAVARWGADQVAWVLAFDGDPQARKVGRWKRIGRAVFGDISHAPVVLFPGDTPWTIDEFRNESWLDAFECQSISDFTDDGLKWAFEGILSREWAKQPARPLIQLLPFENAVGAQSKLRFTSDQIRHAAFWSLCLAPPAGICYGADGVVNWQSDQTTSTPHSALRTPQSEAPLWQKSLFLPAAKWMPHLASFMNSFEYWNCLPRPSSIVNQPGAFSPSRQVTALGTEDFNVVYVPEDRSVEVYLSALPNSPTLTWQNPRTGETSPAVGVVGDNSCQFPTPDPGDWLLLMKSGR